MAQELPFIIGSIIFSAFFSGMEIAYIASNKFQLELQLKKKGITSKLVDKMTRKSSKFITTMLVGNNIALVVYSFFMGEYIFSTYFSNTQLNDFYLLLIQTGISTFFILIFAEFLPKAIFRIFANETLWFFAPLTYFFYVTFHYISIFITYLSDGALRVFFNSSKKESKKKFGKEELGNFITEQLERSEDSEIDSEIQIFQNALEFHNVKAREIMIPRTEIVAVDIGESITTLNELFINTGYSKVLVYKTSLDEVLGYVHASELFKRPKNIRSTLLPVEYVPESMMINNILKLLTKKKRSIAVVLDEFGGTSGIITIEDIVEELFGEIIDEHDTVELIENKISDNEYHFSTRLEVDYLNETYNLGIEESDTYGTLGGYIVNHTEEIPKKNEIIKFDGFVFKVLEVEASKIKEVYLKIT